MTREHDPDQPVVDDGEFVDQVSHTGSRRKIVYLTVPLFVAGFVVYSLTQGLPTKRSNVLLWMVLAIIAFGAGRPQRTFKSLLLDWSPIFIALGLYDLLRGLSDKGNATAHTFPQHDFDTWLGRGTLPTVHLQKWLHATDGVRWYDYIGWVTYTSHFLLPLAIAVTLQVIGSPRFRPYLYGLALLSYMGLLTYYLYPAKPPWMTGQEHLNPHVTRIIHGVWKHVGVDAAARVYEPSHVSGRTYSNEVAALPSLHGAFPMFIFMMLRGIRPWLTAVLGLYVVMMGFTLVYAGEHFVFDVLMGWIYAIVAALVMQWLFRVFERRREARGAAAPVVKVHA
jgi:membrane-associated phospholipid phosphatase